MIQEPEAPFGVRLRRLRQAPGLTQEELAARAGLSAKGTTELLDRYSHWIPRMGRHAADGMDEALG
jgi:hypothetical protein